MSWRDSIIAAQARLVALEAAELKALTGQVVKKVTYAAQGVEYSDSVSAKELARALFETRAVINQLSGRAPAGGRIVPVFRG